MQVRVRVPATTANLGPGFDCLGAALGIVNEFVFTPAPSFTCQVTSTVRADDAKRVATDASNLAWRAFRYLFEHLGKSVPGMGLQITMHVPLGRGLGSSATAIVGGLAAANAWLGSPLEPAEWLLMAARLEGHPDNVVPAALGGCQLALLGETLVVCPLGWNLAIVPVLAVPDFTLSTSHARAALPGAVPHVDAVFNSARTALLVRALATANDEWLRQALDDRLHQPYRSPLIPGWEAVRNAARGGWSLGVVVSGAGPSLLALAPADRAGAVADAMSGVWTDARIYQPGLSTKGCTIEVL